MIRVIKIPLLARMKFEQILVTFWWTQPIRTISEISAHIKISPIRQIPLYQKLSIKAKQLHTLGMSYQKISESLNTSEATIIRAWWYIVISYCILILIDSGVYLFLTKLSLI